MEADTPSPVSHGGPAGYVLTDDGYIIDDLRNAGCEITTPKRRQILEAVLNGFGVRMSGESLEIEATQKTFSLRKHNLIQAMLAVGDLFYLAQPSVAAVFSEDVSDWLRREDIRYTPNVRFSGRSGLDHHFHFVIPASQRQPERIVQAINHPDRNSAEIVAFAWMDTRDTRPSGSTAFAVLNDRQRRTPTDILDALQRYEVEPLLWSQRNEFVEVLRD